MTPARSTAPGALLLVEIQARGWSVRELAARLGYDTGYVWGILDRDTPIDQEVADALGRVMGTSAGLWLDLEAAYRGEQAAPTE